MSPSDPVNLAPTAILISAAGMAAHSHLRMGDNLLLLCSQNEGCDSQFSFEGGAPLDPPPAIHCWDPYVTVALFW